MIGNCPSKTCSGPAWVLSGLSLADLESAPRLAPRTEQPEERASARGRDTNRKTSLPACKGSPAEFAQ